MKYKAASVQFEPRQGDVDYNKESLEYLIRQAVDAGAKLIVTPEMGLTGYCWDDRKHISEYVQTIPGQSTDYFCRVANELGCYIVVGLPEKDEITDIYYNSAVLIGPEGVIGVHRKSHPYISEPKWSSIGDYGHQVFDTPIGKIGLLICMDIHFIETARIMAIDGVDVICHISNWLDERTPAPYWISRAYENSCYLIESNRWGYERGVQFSGGSCIISPEGKVISSIDSGDGLCFGEIVLSRSGECSSFDTLFGRRTELYYELMHHSHLWNPESFYSLYGQGGLPVGSKSKVAVAQLLPAIEIDDNIRKIAETVNEFNDVDLLVFPELYLTGGRPKTAECLRRDSFYFTEIQKICLENNSYIITGFAEVDRGHFYNSSVLVGPEGIVDVYRKIHLSEVDREWALPGEYWSICDTRLGRVGMLIGEDALYPESTRILALKGSDLVAVPASIDGCFYSSSRGTAIKHPHPIPTGSDIFHWHHFRVRAGENNVYFAFSNLPSSKLPLGAASGVFGPETFSFPRKEAFVCSDSGVAVLEIDTTSSSPSVPTSPVRRKDMISMRMAHMYKNLVLNN